MYDIGEHERNDRCTDRGAVACTWLSSECDWTSGHRIWHKKYKHMHQTGTVSECMTLASMSEMIDVLTAEQLHAHDCHQNVTEPSGHRIWHKKYKHMHQTGTVSQAIASSVKQSVRYVTHGPIWMCCTLAHIMCSAGHMGHDVASTRLAWTR